MPTKWWPPSTITSTLSTPTGIVEPMAEPTAEPKPLLGKPEGPTEAGPKSSVYLADTT